MYTLILILKKINRIMIMNVIVMFRGRVKFTYHFCYWPFKGCDSNFEFNIKFKFVKSCYK